jgi:GT2 family glycosyltransferase
LIDVSNTGLIDRFFEKYIVAMPVQTQMARPQWTSFASVLINDGVFQQVGLLDEGYFMYFEDVEFCHRARLAGWTIIHNPLARVVHLRGGSSSVKEQARIKKRVPKYFYASRTRYFYQTYGWLGLTSANLLWWLGRIVSGTRQLLGRHDKAVVEGQWLDIWTNWLNPLEPKTVPKL